MIKKNLQGDGRELLNTVFKFRGFFLSKEAESSWEQLNEAFFTALTELGIGAKIAVGYGRFEVLGDNGGPEVKKTF